MDVDPAPLRLPLATAVLLRGKTEKTSEAYLAALGEAMQPYRERRYAESVRQLASLESRYPKAVEPAFYLGVSQLLSGEYSNAIASLEEARKLGGDALNDDIAWYLAIARERTGNWNSAAELLQSLCANDGSYRAAACKGLGHP